MTEQDARDIVTELQRDRRVQLRVKEFREWQQLFSGFRVVPPLEEIPLGNLAVPIRRRRLERIA